MKAWYFGPDDKLPHGDDRPIVIGETHEVGDEIIPCKHGLHGSKRIIDALGYASHATIYRVELSGTLVEHDGDKFAASRRTYLWKIDGTEVLRKFARRCALDVIHLWEAPDIVVSFLKTGENAAAADAERAAVAARVAADAQAAEAAAVTAWASAVAERAAERATTAAWAAGAAAERAAAAAAGWAARGARAAAANDKQNRRLTRMVMEEHRRQKWKPT